MICNNVFKLGIVNYRVMHINLFGDSGPHINYPLGDHAQLNMLNMLSGSSA